MPDTKGNFVASNIFLTDIAMANATPMEARKAIMELLESGGTPCALDIYVALRALVWKMLDRRRRDAELRQWCDIISATSAILAPTNPEVAARLETLAELLGESITVGEILGREDLAKRSHVAQVLQLLSREGPVDRIRIGEFLELNTTLIGLLNLMMMADLIERDPYGKDSLFRLTAKGSSAAISV